MDNLINTILISYMRSLDDSSTDFINHLKKYKDSFKNDKYKNKIAIYMDQETIFSNQIYTHMNLDNCEITSVNFYKHFQSFFDSNIHHKKVEYYIQNGFRNKLEQVTDPKILNEEFVIPNCFNSMSLVPLNIASNARKYLPEGGTVTVCLTNEDTYKYITVTNIGPQLKDEDIKDYKRGENAAVVAGMGLGASQVKMIIKMHSLILDTTFNSKSSNKVIYVNDVPYSEFTTQFSFNTILEKTDFDTTEEFRSRIPSIILHNLGEITANMLAATLSLHSIKFKGDSLWHLLIESQILNINRMQDIMKVCLFAKNNYSIDYLLGNRCNINVGSAITNNLEVFKNYIYSKKDIELSIQGTRFSIDGFSGLYPILYGICNLIFSALPDSSYLEVEMNKDLCTVEFKCENTSFVKALKINSPLKFESEKDISIVQYHLYRSVFDELNIGFVVDNECIVIDF